MGTRLAVLAAVISAVTQFFFRVKVAVVVMLIFVLLVLLLLRVVGAIFAVSV